MKTQEIADLVKIRIEEKIQQEMQAHKEKISCILFQWIQEILHSDYI